MSIKFEKTDDIELLYHIRKDSLSEYFIKRDMKWDEGEQKQKFKNDIGESEPYKILNNNQLIGYISIQQKEKEINIAQMYLYLRYQNQGLGGNALEKLMALYQNLKKPYTLHTSINNIEAQNFYIKLGFVEMIRNEKHIYFKKRAKLHDSITFWRKWANRVQCF